MFKKHTPWTETDSVTTGELDRLESGISDAYYQSEALPLGTVTRSVTYTGDNITKIEDMVSNVLRREIVYSYTGDNLTGKTVKVFSTDGNTILEQYSDTYGYTGDNITSHGRTVA